MKSSYVSILILMGAHAVGTSLARRQTCELGWDVSIGNQGLNDEVSALAVHDDGTGLSLFAGGRFDMAGGNQAARVAKWNGESWSPLGTGVGGGPDDIHPRVNAMISFDDGNGPGLFAGGYFARAGDVANARSIAVWRDGAWSTLGAGITDGFGERGFVESLAVFDDGTGPALFAAGAFRMTGPVPIVTVAKWNGTDWSPLGDGLDGAAEAMTVFDDGSGLALYVAGRFHDPAGRGTTAIVKWDGQVWRRLAGDSPRGDWYILRPCPPIGRFCPVLDPPAGSALGVFDPGEGEALFLAGWFKGTRSHDLDIPAEWNGRRWTSMHGGAVDGRVDAFAAHDDGTWMALFAGGVFTTAGSVEANGVARWDGRLWSALGDGFGAGSVSALLSFDDGSGPALYAGGEFETAGGQSTQNIARWKCRE